MKINILIRTSGRPKAFRRCIESICTQTFRNIHLIVSVDDTASLQYATATLNKWSERITYQVIEVQKNPTEFGYNLYLNNLLPLVIDGWFIILDDDDTLAHKLVIERLFSHVCETAGDIKMIVFQMKRGTIVKPMTAGQIGKPGKIGMPCFMLHSSMKDKGVFTHDGDADFKYINDVIKTTPFHFINQVIVNVSKRGHGKAEKIK